MSVKRNIERLEQGVKGNLYFERYTEGSEYHVKSSTITAFNNIGLMITSCRNWKQHWWQAIRHGRRNLTVMTKREKGNPRDHRTSTDTGETGDWKDRPGNKRACDRGWWTAGNRDCGDGDTEIPHNDSVWCQPDRGRTDRRTGGAGAYRKCTVLWYVHAGIAEYFSRYLDLQGANVEAKGYYHQTEKYIGW